MSDTFLQFLPQQLINGLTLGSLYALIAIGYTMVYGIIGMINFAHGEIYMIGAYIGLIVMSALMMWGVDALPMLLALAFIVSIGFSGMYGWTLERVAYRQLRGRHRLIPLISAIGMSIFLQNFMQLGQGARDVALPQLLSGGFDLHLGGAVLYVSYIQVVIWTINIATMVLLALFIGRTRLGRACRATSQDRLMASLLGIDTDRVISVTFIIGAMLAALAGVLVILYYGVANAYMGFIIGIKAFTAAVLGGIGSIPGAVIGGLLLGFSESFASAFLSTEYKDVVAFCLLLIVLLFRPTGILGKPEVEKV